MPLLKLHTSTPVPEATAKTLMPALSKIVAECFGKPEQYVMVSLETTPILMAGKSGTAAFVDIRSIGGLSGAVNKAISQKVCALLESELGVPAGRTYINFTSFAGVNWGWNSGTFA